MRITKDYDYDSFAEFNKKNPNRVFDIMDFVAECSKESSFSGVGDNYVLSITIPRVNNDDYVACSFAKVEDGRVLILETRLF